MDEDFEPLLSFSRSDILPVFGIKPHEWTDLTRRRVDVSEGESDSPFVVPSISRVGKKGVGSGRSYSFLFKDLFIIYLAKLFKKHGIDRILLRDIDLAMGGRMETDKELKRYGYPPWKYYTEKKKGELGCTYFLHLLFGLEDEVVFATTREDVEGNREVYSSYKLDPRKGRFRSGGKISGNSALDIIDSRGFPMRLTVNLNSVRDEIVSWLVKAAILKRVK